MYNLKLVWFKLILIKLKRFLQLSYHLLKQLTFIGEILQLVNSE